LRERSSCDQGHPVVIPKGKDAVRGAKQIYSNDYPPRSKRGKGKERVPKVTRDSRNRERKEDGRKDAESTCGREALSGQTTQKAGHVKYISSK
jgi:hypothetical protein